MMWHIFIFNYTLEHTHMIVHEAFRSLAFTMALLVAENTSQISIKILVIQSIFNLL